MKKKVGIVGAGVGGLATAVRLARRGYQVEVFEKMPRCGGRAHIIEDRGFRFDTGPSFVLMPPFFDELFSFCGKRREDYLDFLPLDVHYRIFYADGKKFTVYRDTEKMKQELERMEPGASRRYENFLRDVGEMYKAVKPLLYKCFTPRHLLQPRYWGLLWKLHTHQTYWQIARKFFKTEELAYAFTFEAMFIGVSPFHAPAFYSVITYSDHMEKIYHPRGGMYQIPKSLEGLAAEFGARFHYGHEVKKIDAGRDGVTLDTDRGEFRADKVTVNADYVHAQKDLLRRNIPRYKYSCSVYLLYLGVKKKICGLDHHNLFFGEDLERNLREIFNDYVVPQRPAFYVHIPTFTDTSMAPEGKDIVYILIPVPNTERESTDFESHKLRLRGYAFDKISAVIGERLEDLIEVEHEFLPRDFTDRYNVHNAATFGLSHTLMQSAFFRPPNIDPRCRNLYYVGCSTQPGEGLPPVIASSKIVADLISGKKAAGAVSW
ncbi:MAG: phytoene desaturase [Candidatus Omnitrophica bacterium]|nr:phytoene desaturase [Candidatus Omnitrophota bacterium]